MALGALVGLAVHLALSLVLIGLYLLPFGMNERIYHLAAFGWVLPAVPGAVAFGAVLGGRAGADLGLRRLVWAVGLAVVNALLLAPLVLLVAIGDHPERGALLFNYYGLGLITAYLLGVPSGWGIGTTLLLHAAQRTSAMRSLGLAATACLVLGLPLVRWPVRKEGLFARPRVNEALLDHRPADALRAVEAGEPVDVMDRTGSYALIEASEAGDAALVRALLARGASVAVTDDHDRTAIQLAAAGGNVEVLRALVAAGADVNTGAAKGSTPLSMAVGGGRAEAVRFLLESGARPGVKGATGQDLVRTALDGGHQDVAALLAEKGIGRLPEREMLGRALVAALGKGDMQEAAALVGKGADPNASDRAGTALVQVVQRDEASLVALLLSAGADPNAHRPGEDPALVWAVRVDPALVPPLLSRGARPDALAFGEAAELGDLEVVRALAAARADLAAKSDGKTAMERAARAGNADVVSFLRQAGAPPVDVSVREWREKDARLMKAAEEGKPGDVRLWLRHGADANHPHFQPLLKAAEAGHAEIVDLLLAAGADPRARDPGDRTALELAGPHTDVAARLRRALAAAR